MLVKFMHYEDDQDMIKGVQHRNPVELLKILKEVTSVDIAGEPWEYSHSEMRPTFDDVHCDALYVFLRPIDLDTEV